MGGDVSAARGATIIVHFGGSGASFLGTPNPSLAARADLQVVAAQRPGAGGGPFVVFAQARFFSLVFSGSAIGCWLFWHWVTALRWGLWVWWFFGLSSTLWLHLLHGRNDSITLHAAVYGRLKRHGDSWLGDRTTHLPSSLGKQGSRCVICDTTSLFGGW
jgi:hypothetical protein